MVGKTQSGKWFESMCDEKQVPFIRIQESDFQTPDYEIEVSGQKIIVEVKEILPNPEEKTSIKKMEREGVGLATGGSPGARVRNKINSASGQIKARTGGRLPSILVLCDIRYGCGQIGRHLDPYNIRVGMDGLDQVVFAVPNDVSKTPYSIGMISGPKKKMTDRDNTSISALGVLHTPLDQPISIFVYHNRYAAIPIESNLLKDFASKQFCLEGQQGECLDWVEV